MEMWKTAAPPMESRYSRPDGKAAGFPTARKHRFPQLRNPLCHNGEPGVGQHGAELSPLPAGPGLPGVSHYDLRGDLRGAGGEHFFERRQHFRRHLGLYGVHGAPVLHPL